MNNLQKAREIHRKQTTKPVESWLNNPVSKKLVALLIIVLAMSAAAEYFFGVMQ